MQCTAEPHTGFWTSAKTVHPVIAKGPYRYDQVNVEAQWRDLSSLLSWSAAMIG
jgi:maltose alpha-D-glucosyltransferase / alpha-amylase